MKLSTNVNLRREPFHINYRKTSESQQWEVFHFHQAMELLYVYEGTGTAIVGHRMLPIEPGTLLLFQPFQLHRLVVSDRFVRTVLMFDPHAVEAYIQPFGRIRHLFQSLWKSGLQQQSFRHPKLGPELEEAFDRLVRHLSTVPYDKQADEYGLLLLSCLHSLSAYDRRLEAKELPKRMPHHIEAVILWLEDHYKEKLSLEQLAADLHLSPYYVSHSFTQITGSSITDYMLGRRIKEACRLLETTSLTISAIALDIGFSNPSYFCKLFKQYVGVTPLKFREQARRV
ncbi:AraC family transcriptional regulator [Paenibacillus sp. PL2-23]|uniref:AraC family transcriptional regulator n=1 Tax=Paenibacillus sp. PL2-23 TaxID=2100729 RepID=UPI0030F4E96C